MNGDTPVEKVRQAISAHLVSLGVPNASLLQEAILISNGLFCGRKFQCCDYQVLWFLEEDEIKFFGPTGDILQVMTAIDCIRSFEAAQDPHRHAA